MVQSKPPRTNQFKTEAEDFKDDWGDHRRDKETGRRAI